MVNRGDSFRRRRSRSNSLAPAQHDSTGDVSGSKNRTQQFVRQQESQPIAAAAAAAAVNQQQTPSAVSDRLCPAPAPGVVKTYRVAVIGAHGVGKSALIAQFMTSDCINAYDRVRNGTKKLCVAFLFLNSRRVIQVKASCFLHGGHSVNKSFDSSTHTDSLAPLQNLNFLVFIKPKNNVVFVV